MIPARFAPYLFSLILSALMSLLVSGVATLRALGAVDGFLWIWLTAWLNAWVVAYPALLLVSPLTRRIVARLTMPAE